MRPLLRLLVVANVVLALAALPAAPAAAAGSRDCARVVDGIDLQTATIPEMEAAMAAGTLTSLDLVDAYLHRIAAFDTGGPKLDAIRTLAPTARAQAAALDAERAAGHVRGPLHGIPVLLKDNVSTFDMPTTAGSIALEGAQPVRDATITRRLRAAGAIILGKTNLSEFANWVSLGAANGWSSLGGQVHNAYTGGDPSGSSSGSGVAASMAFAAATIGTETSGSILSPTDANGDAGVKPTMGLASRAGILPLSPSFDVPGPITRNVTDAATVLGVIAGADPEDAATAASQPSNYVRALRTGALEGTRLAYSQDARDGLDAQRQALFDKGLDRLRRLGAVVTPVQALTAQYVGITELGFIPNEFKASLNQYLADWEPNARSHNLDEVYAYAQAHPEKYPYGTDLLQVSDAMPGQAALYPAAASVQQAARADIEAALAEGGAEAVITPGPAHANIGAAAGYPTVETHLGYLGKQPFDFGFMGRPFSEAKLLAYAYDYEQDTHTRVLPTALNSSLTPAC
ncbi:MAG: amidase [Solirubrobacteraceae bacterium]|nr:amidase [Solirubrobacteraceae bacterium]